MTARVSILVALLCSLVGAAGEDAGCSVQLAQVQGELGDAQKQLLWCPLVKPTPCVARHANAKILTGSPWQ